MKLMYLEIHICNYNYWGYTILCMQKFHCNDNKFYYEYTTCIHTQLNRSADMPNDAQRIQRVKLLADNGYADRVVIAQDMHLKHRLVNTHHAI